MQPKYTLNGTVHDVTPVRRADRITLQIDGRQLDVRLQWVDGHQGEITVNGSMQPFFAAQDGNVLFIHFDGKVWQLDAYDEFGDSRESGASGGKVCAPMPGVVVEVFVSEGDIVSAGTTLMLIESMKLQTEIKATTSGVVVNVAVEAGSSFDKGSVLIDIEASEREE